MISDKLWTGIITWSGVAISVKTFLGEQDRRGLLPSAFRGDSAFLGEADLNGLTPSALSGEPIFFVGVLVTLPRWRGSEAVEVAAAGGGSEAVLFSLREFSLLRRLERRAGKSRCACFVGAILPPLRRRCRSPQLLRLEKTGLLSSSISPVRFRMESLRFSLLLSGARCLVASGGRTREFGEIEQLCECEL